MGSVVLDVNPVCNPEAVTGVWLLLEILCGLGLVGDFRINRKSETSLGNDLIFLNQAQK